MEQGFVEGVDTKGTELRYCLHWVLRDWVIAKNPLDKTAQRLAQLEETGDTVKQTLKLNQKEYEKHIEKLHEDLREAWDNEERVKSLKIAIQVQNHMCTSV